ncbi:MAG TPA: hypothetical protein DHV52_00860 [Parachlamydiales bacterium]|nr:hypothetical protein [Parachlamydiales bacterium]
MGGRLTVLRVAGQKRFFLFFLFLTLSLQLHGTIMWLSQATNLAPNVASSVIKKPGELADVSVNDSGQAIVVWVEKPSAIIWTVNYAAFTPQGGWSESRVIATQTLDVVTDFLNLPRAFLNNSGQILVVWRRYIGGDNRLFFSINRFGLLNAASWSDAALVTPDRLNQATYGLDMNNLGQAVVCYDYHTGDVPSSASRSCFYSFGESSWSTPLNLASLAQQSLFIKTAINDAGTVLATFDSVQVGGPNVFGYASTFSALSTTGWGTRQQLETLNNGINIPSQLGLNANSQGVSVGALSTYALAATPFTGGSWQSAVTVKAAGGVPNTSLQGTIDDTGRMVVAWSEGTGSSYAVKVATAMVTDPSNWTTTTLATSSNVLEDVVLAVMPNGSRAFVLWEEIVGVNGVIKATDFVPSAPFPSVVTLSSPASSDWEGQANAINAQGLFVGVWSNSLYAQAGLTTGIQLSGKQKTNRFLTQIEYYNHLFWNSVLYASYRLYANGSLVEGTTNTRLDHRGQKKGRPVSYSLSLVGPSGIESERSAPVNVP